MSAALEAARELERALGELMRVLDAREADPDALEFAARACSQGFDALRASFEETDPALGAQAARTLRSNAVALDLARRRLATAGERLDQVRSVRRVLARQSDPTTSTGEACDVAG